jgi:hypothetical protein
MPLDRRYRPSAPALGIGSFEIVRADRSDRAARAAPLRWTAGLTLASSASRDVPFPDRAAAGMADPSPVRSSARLDGLAIVPDDLPRDPVLPHAGWLLTMLFFRAVETGSITLKH